MTFEEKYSGDNGLCVTTWAYCWRCGGKINPRHKYNVQSGVHDRCSSYAGDRIAMHINSFEQKVIVYPKPENM